MSYLDAWLSKPGERPGTLSQDQARAFWERIELPASLFDDIIAGKQASTVKLLGRIQLAHALAVPFETTANQLPRGWGTGSREGVSLFNADPKHLGAPPDVAGLERSTTLLNLCFERVVLARRGGFCFVLNHLFAGLLRALGFSVSEVTGRVYIHRNKNPKEVGYAWTLMSHQALLVRCPGDNDDKRYLVDIGFGGGQPVFPIPLAHLAEIESITPGEKFHVVNTPLPGVDAEEHSVLKDDLATGWMVERWVGEYYSPCYWIEPTSRTEQDLEMLCWWNTAYPTAPFRTLLIVTRLLPDGARRTIMWDRARAATEQEAGHKSVVRCYTKKNVTAAEEDIIEFGATEGDLWAVCQREFGFKAWPSSTSQIDAA